MKALESLKCFKPVHSPLLIKNRYFTLYGSLAYEWILSISCCWFIRLNNEFVFPYSDPPVINILYGCTEACGQFRLWNFMFSFGAWSKLIIFCIVLINC